MNNTTLAMLACAMLVSRLPGDNVIVSYNFADGTGDAEVSADGITAEPAAWVGITSNHGFDGATGTAYVQTSGLPQPPYQWQVDDQQYLEVTIKAEPGRTFSLDKLTFQFGGTNKSENPRGVRAVVRSSVDNFSTTFPLADQGRVTVAEFTHSPLLSDFEVDLGGGDFNRLNEVTFRFYTGVSGIGIMINACYARIRFFGKVSN
jgi:protein involved in ribonucleotide reduction